MRDWFTALISLILVGAAFQIMADMKPDPIRRRIPVSVAAVPNDWTSTALRHGRRRTIQSRRPRPKLAFESPAADAYRVRVFYYLDGPGPASLSLSGGWPIPLGPGGRWRRTIFSAPFLPKGEKLEISFDLAEGARLTLRRVDIRNYYFRIASFFAVKPPGGARSPAGAGWWLALAGFFLVLGAARILKRPLLPTTVAAVLTKIFLPAGILGLAAILVQFFSEHSIHAHPALAGGLFAAVSVRAAFPAKKSSFGLKAGRLAMVSAATAAALLIAEGAIILWDPPISRPRVKSYIKYSPDFGWMNRPLAKGWHVDIGYHIRINRFGHRGPAHAVEKPKNTLRILGLGDSFSFGWGVEDKNTYLRVLEKRLRGKGRRVEVINAGVPAWHSVQSLAYLLKRGLRFKPDLVIAEFFVDDVYLVKLGKILKSPKAAELREEEEEVRRRKSSSGWTPRLYHIWFNYRKIRNASRDHLRRNPYPDFESERKILPRDFDKKPEKVAGLKKMLARWRRVRDETGIPIVLFYMPAGGAIHSPPHQGEFRALRRESAAAGLPFADVLTLMNNHPAPRTLYLHPRDGHMSAKGHALVGEALARLVLDGKWRKK